MVSARWRGAGRGGGAQGGAVAAHGAVRGLRQRRGAGARARPRPGPRMGSHSACSRTRWSGGGGRGGGRRGRRRAAAGGGGRAAGERGRSGGWRRGARRGASWGAVAGHYGAADAALQPRRGPCCVRPRRARRPSRLAARAALGRTALNNAHPAPLSPSIAHRVVQEHRALHRVLELHDADADGTDDDDLRRRARGAAALVGPARVAERGAARAARAAPPPAPAGPRAPRQWPAGGLPHACHPARAPGGAPPSAPSPAAPGRRARPCTTGAPPWLLPPPPRLLRCGTGLGDPTGPRSPARPVVGRWGGRGVRRRRALRE
jgi:hypothetical protein